MSYLDYKSKIAVTQCVPICRRTPIYGHNMYALIWAKTDRRFTQPSRQAGVRLLALYSDSLQLEMATSKERPHADKLSCGIFFGREVSLVDCVKRVEERQVRPGNLHVHEIVHGHSGLRQDFFFAVQQQLDFLFDFLRRFSRFRIQPDPSR